MHQYVLLIIVNQSSMTYLLPVCLLQHQHNYTASTNKETSSFLVTIFVWLF